MGMFAAVGSVYANMFNFSGRARRAEYWWYAFFTFVVSLLLQGGAVYWLFSQTQLLAGGFDEAQMQILLKEYQSDILRWSGYIFVGTLFLYWIPYLAVTVRRLHDTGRSGWWMFVPFLVGILLSIALSVVAVFAGVGGAPSPALILMASTVPLACSIWFIVVLCLPGNHGDNRFGPDPVPDRPRKEAGHPALVKEMDQELSRMVEERRKEEFSDYYRARVLPAIERNKARRTSPIQ